MSKSIRKKSKKFRLTINQSFDRVVEECRRQHPRCWLYPELVRVFKEIHDAGQVDSVVNPCANTMNNPSQIKTAPVRMYSIEIWNDETGELAAGELGYTVGSIYTSLTGFSAQDSAGSVQLASLGRLLCKMGFTLWDLGMNMEYKQGLGSHLMDRKDFVAHVAKVRVTKGHNRLPLTNANGFNCKSLIDQELSLTSLSTGGQQQTTTVKALDATATATSAVNSSRSSNVDRQRGSTSGGSRQQLRRNSTVRVHHDHTTSDNQNASPKPNIKKQKKLL